MAKPTRAYPTWPLTRVVTWAGTRGVMPLAAALSIPLVAGDGAPLPGRGLVLVLTTAVVAATLTVQGLSLAGIVRTSGLAIAPEHAAAKEQAARAAMDRAVVEYLDDLAAVGGVNELAVTRLRGRYAERLDPETDAALLEDLATLRRDVLSVQAAGYGGCSPRSRSAMACDDACKPNSTAVRRGWRPETPKATQATSRAARLTPR